jgi:hypothetical protein
MLGRLLSLARVSRRDPELVLLALRVYALLIVSRAIITLVPLRRIARYLGTPMVETPSDGIDPVSARYARRVSWCISKLSPHTPTESNCYPQALTARWLLHRRGIPTTFYYGAAFEPGRPALATHVWLRCGAHVVTGGRARLQFQPLTYFADETARRRDRRLRAVKSEGGS